MIDRDDGETQVSSRRWAIAERARGLGSAIWLRRVRIRDGVVGAAVMLVCLVGAVVGWWGYGRWRAGEVELVTEGARWSRRCSL